MMTREARMRFFFFLNSFVILLLCLFVTPTNATAPQLLTWGPSLPTNGEKQEAKSKAAGKQNALQQSIKPRKASEKHTSVQVSRDDRRIAVRNGKARISKRDMELLARLVYAEGRGEPYEGQVAIAAVVLNRVESPQFPNTVYEVIFARNAFSPVKNGRLSPDTNETARRAVIDAVNGQDPSRGALYFFNPNTATSDWIRSRTPMLRIQNHVFAR
ncbi:cell wall hydrolase [Brevibacillus borstelensis]|uniref:cell wall hydrolase n=1 Tax=Brevibacillus borstelensis TaxID=45462 RepID=UPI0030C114FD